MVALRKSGKKGGKATGPLLKEIEKAMRSVKLYPVAVNAAAKDAAVEALRKAYSKGGDSVRQHVLFLINEMVAQASDLRVMKTYEHFRQKSPKQAPGSLRMSVYREMFDYTSSVEGLAELVLLLGELEGDEPAKLLSHFFSSLCASDSELNRMLRNASIEALGSSDSPYALKALMDYARLTDSDKLFGRMVGALSEWAGKIDTLELPAADKGEMKEDLKDLMAKEEKPTQYG
jgi:hypothetical protein